jgi:hypothetical protein
MIVVTMVIAMLAMQPADFAGVTTTASARRLVRSRVLRPVALFPHEFGGPKDAHNVAYVTPDAEARRAALIAELRPRIASGELETMDVEPAYRGDSVVPTRIVMIAHRRAGGDVRLTIDVW